MANPEKYHLARIAEQFGDKGNVPSLDRESAVYIARNLAARGFACIGGVLPGDKLGDKSDATSDAKTIKNELNILRLNHAKPGTEVQVGPYIRGMDAENDGTHYSRGAMLYVRTSPTETE